MSDVATVGQFEVIGMWQWDKLTSAQRSTTSKVTIICGDDEPLETARCLIDYCKELKNMALELPSNDAPIMFPNIETEENVSDTKNAKDAEKVAKPIVDRLTISKILDWCYHIHYESLPKQNEEEPEISKEEKQNRKKLNEKRHDDEMKWTKPFFSCDDQEEHFDLFCHIMNATNFLDIPELLDYGCEILMNDISHRTVEDIQRRYEIVDDLTEEEKREIDEEDIWTKPGDPDNPMPESLRRIFGLEETSPCDSATSCATSSSS